MTVSVATVIGIWRYPVKSMGGEPLREAVIGPGGITGDRSFGVVDIDTGKVLSAKTVPQLLEVAVAWAGATVRFLDPPLAGAMSTDVDIHHRLSDWLGRNVELRRPAEGERAVFEMPDDPDAPSAMLEIRSPAGTFFDSRSTIHLVSDASLRGAAALHPEGNWDPRRFRPNLLVHIAGDGFSEDGWVDQQLSIGSVEATVRKVTGRCVVVVQAQPGIPRDSDIFRSLVGRRGGNLGVYLDPLTRGNVKLDDPVVLNG